MKRPSAEQLRGLQQIAGNHQVMHFLDEAETHMLSILRQEKVPEEIYTLQGSLATLSELRKLILSGKR